MNIEMLKREVACLTPEDLQAFLKWFEVFVNTKWDKQIEADIAAGKWEKIGEQADSDFENGRATPLLGRL
ncbi:MAG: hypothetical protein ACJ8C4_14500 [Gemmataceae bacterium]